MLAVKHFFEGIFGTSHNNE